MTIISYKAGLNVAKAHTVSMVMKNPSLLSSSATMLSSTLMTNCPYYDKMGESRGEFWDAELLNTAWQDDFLQLDDGVAPPDKLPHP